MTIDYNEEILQKICIDLCEFLTVTFLGENIQEFQLYLDEKSITIKKNNIFQSVKKRKFSG